MEIRVLGCFGGELPGFRHCCLEINGRLLLDAGAITPVLNLREQKKIYYILVTHTHLDHIKDIPFLAANLIKEKSLRRPVHIISTAPVIALIKTHLFNDALWPDFSALPTVEWPVLKFVEIKPEVDVQMGNYLIRAIPVNHPVPAVGYFVRQGKSAIIYTGDTGPSDHIWEVANQRPELKALLIETSFPNRLTAIAQESGHLTPRLLQKELIKLKRTDLTILLAHMKPQYLSFLRKEIKKIPYPRISLLRQGVRYYF
ncbi:MAG: MBL fold metallo-hydrolase [Thermodesulfobacteriota bacterium]